jgi:hypothetical protein
LPPAELNRLTAPKVASTALVTARHGIQDEPVYGEDGPVGQYLATTVQEGDLLYRVALRWSALDLAAFVDRVTLIDSEGDLLAGGPGRS